MKSRSQRSELHPLPNHIKVIGRSISEELLHRTMKYTSSMFKILSKLDLHNYNDEHNTITNSLFNNLNDYYIRRKRSTKKPRNKTVSKQHWTSNV